MKRRVAAIAAIALALAILIPAAIIVPRAAADTAWVNTATQGTNLASATSLGALPGATPLHIAVALRLRDSSGLNSYIQAINDPTSAQFGQSLTPTQFAATYGPTDASAQAVTQYLTQSGLTNVQVAPNNLLVSADGTAAQVSAAFNTSLGQFQQNGATVFANTTPAQVPSSLGSIVLSVLGLNNASVMKPTPHHHTTTTPPVGSGPQYCDPGVTSTVPQYPAVYNPQGFWKAYDVCNTPNGGNTSIAIFAEGNLSGVITDLRTEETANNLPQVPVTVVQVGLASPDTSGADEWDMDTQYSTGMAGTVSQLYLYDATSLTDSDLALGFNSFVTQDVAKAGSASFGECEVFPYVDGSMLADDEVFAEAAAQGQTVFASAGDTGGFCAVAPTNGVPGGPPFVNYPASSPYVVAVGGTTLLTNTDNSYNNETAWLAGGGGPSAFEYQPYWQNGVAPPTGTALLGKDLPDIAMDADPNSGANVYINGVPTAVGGTSLSSPLSLGVWARLESAHGNTLGFAAPALYGLEHAYPYPQVTAVPTSATGFHDIILGDTGPYAAAPGWDFATGLGTFDVAQINSVIS